MHRQAIKQVGKGLRVTHRSDIEGVVEGVEYNILPIIGYQWHPERTCLSRKRDGVVDGIKVFESFLEHCKNNK